MLQTVIGVLARAVLIASATVLALGFVALGLLVAAVLLAVWSLRRLWARLSGRPLPQRPAFHAYRDLGGLGRFRRQGRPVPADVVDVQARELS